MPIIPPAVCDRCGTMFSSGIVIDEAKNVTLAGNRAGPCPSCGATGHVPDGVFNFINNTIELLSGPQRTIAELQRLAQVLRAQQRRGASAEEIQSTIRHEAPELASLADTLPGNRSELYAFLALFLTIIGLVSTCWERSEDPKIEINQVINATVQQSASKRSVSDAPPASAAPGESKPGRTDPCPCGSGKKFKRCHGAVG